MLGKWRAWISDRFGLGPIWHHVLHRRVARSPWYFGDGASLAFLLVVLVVTGVAMTVTYSPSPDTAYDSVQHITHAQMLGWFVRGLHYWSAGMMVVMLWFHLFRQLLVGGYKSPREGTWLIGVALFFAVGLMAYTGYLLRWDQRAIAGLRVMLHVLSRVPYIGEGLVYFVQGGEEIGVRTLSRLYSVHAIITPLLIAALVAYHLYLIILHGTTSREERRRPVQSGQEQKELYEAQAHSPSEGEWFYPTTMAHSGLMGLVVFLIALTLTLTVGPPELMAEGDAVQRTLPAEEWWYWWLSALIALLPPWIAPWFVVVFPIALLVVLVLLPFIDRKPYRGMRHRPVMVSIVVIGVAALLYLTDLRRRSPWTAWPDPIPPPVPENVELSPGAERGRLLFAIYGCNSCHAIAGHGRHVGSDLAQLEHRYSRQEMRRYILAPPEGVPMPSYAGRFTEAELDHLLDFVHAAQTFPRESLP